MKVKTIYDPFEENERLASLPTPSRYDNKDNFRYTKTTLIIKSKISDDDAQLRFIHRGDGSLKIQFKENIEIDGYHEESTCDLGHRHLVPKKKIWCYLVEDLSEEDRVRLANWILKGEK